MKVEKPAAFELTADQLVKVRKHLAGRVHRTPVITSRLLDAIAGARLFLKGEHLQRGGAFKIRGALNFLLAHTRSGMPGSRQVVTASSGNHGQAVALAARDLGLAATVVVPEDIAAVKAAAIRDYGAQVEVAGRSSAERLACAEEIARGGALFVPPYDHPQIIEGQATAAAELLEDVPGLDAVVVPVGGGGLIAGTSLAIDLLSPSVRVIGVETEAADDACRSFRSGKKVRIPLPDTIADGIRNLELGNLNWEVIRTHVDEMVTVSEAEVALAMQLLFMRAKVVAEPTGAVAAAAVLAGKVGGARVAAIVSGGNVDPDTFARLLAARVS